MNWTAFDHRRGLKSDEVAKAELDAMETRLIDMVHRIRETAGEMSSEAEDVGPAEEIVKKQDRDFAV